MTNITETTSSRIHVGLDVHKDTVVVAVARRTLDSDDLVVEDRGDFKNRPASLKRWLAALTHEYDGTLHFVYEAGPCGFVMWRQLRGWGHACEVVAPSLIPKKSGDRVKTDRRDARELAKLSLLGYLTPIWVPSETREAMRDLVRLRLDMKQMIQKQRQQLNHFLLRHGHAWSLTKWTERHRVWMKDRSFAEPAQQLTLMTSLASLADQERRLATLDHDLLTHAAAWEWSGLVDSLRALRGIDYLTAITVLAEIGDLRRFRNPAQFMAYLGLVPSEFSSGTRRRTGAITKTGTAWCVASSPRVPGPIDSPRVKRGICNTRRRTPPTMRANAHGRRRNGCAVAIAPWCSTARTTRRSSRPSPESWRDSSGTSPATT